MNDEQFEIEMKEVGVNFDTINIRSTSRTVQHIDTTASATAVVKGMCECILRYLRKRIICNTNTILKYFVSNIYGWTTYFFICVDYY